MYFSFGFDDTRQTTTPLTTKVTSVPPTTEAPNNRSADYRSVDFILTPYGLKFLSLAEGFP